MKEALRKKSVIVQLIVYCSLLLILFALYLTLYYGFDITIFEARFVFLFITVLLFAIGFISSDLSVVRYLRKEKNWADKVPVEVKEKAWRYRTPFYLSAVLSLFLTLVLDFLYLTIG